MIIGGKMLEPVEPGTILNLIPLKVGKIRAKKDKVKVKVPARIHLSVLDMTKFAPRKPGGGGLGYGIGLYAEASVELSDDFCIKSKRKTIVEHTAKVLAKSVGYEGGFLIEAHDHGMNHLGLGSTSATMSAVAYAVNAVLGKPLDLRDLRRLIGYNFVEEWSEEKVVPGFETGVGPAVGYYGGFVVISDDLEVIHRSCIPDDREVLLCVPQEESTLRSSRNAGEEEAELLLNEARKLDMRDKEKKAHEVLINLLPKAMKGDIEAVGNSIWKLQFLGSKIAEIEHHEGGKQIYDLMKTIRERGAEIVGMSSVGSTIAAVFPKDCKAEMQNILDDRQLIKTISTRPDNIGVKILED
jgi:beta-RFAP synthase